MQRYLLIAVIAGLWVSTLATAQPIAPPAIDGVKPVNLFPKFPQDVPSADGMQAEKIRVSEQPFDEALRIRITKKPQKPHMTQVNASNQRPIRKGERLVLSYWVRPIATASEWGEVITGTWSGTLNGGGLKKFAGNKRWASPMGTGWKRIDRAIVADRDVPAGDAVFQIQLGFDEQAMDVGGYSLWSYGTEVDPGQLPETTESLDYPGRSPDHPWRKEAAERIEQHRKADLVVEVVDAQGQPVPNAKVHVAMQQHDYDFGTMINHRSFTMDGPKTEDAEKLEKVVELFNAATLTWYWRWNWEHPSKPQVRNVVTRWALDHGMDVRGHTVLWPSFNRTPTELESLRDDPKALAAAIDQHIVDAVGGLAGIIDEWDLVNEFTGHTDLVDILGEDAMAHWFKLAKQVNPDAVLYINENSVLNGLKVANVERVTEMLLSKGAPVGGIGVQGHLGITSTDPLRTQDVLDRLGRFDLPIKITELDISSSGGEKEADAADALRDLMTMFFSHPSTAGIIMWGFQDDDHWKGDGLLLREDGSAKPALDVWKRLIFDEWWTDEHGTTDSGGRYTTRGFHGDYEVTAEANGRRGTSRVRLDPAGQSVRITLN